MPVSELVKAKRERMVVTFLLERLLPFVKENGADKLTKDQLLTLAKDHKAEFGQGDLSVVNFELITSAEFKLIFWADKSDRLKNQFLYAVSFIERYLRLAEENYDSAIDELRSFTRVPDVSDELVKQSLKQLKKLLDESSEDDSFDLYKV